eukprot:gnl/TRDRNA2_/TRDRNA2_43094_c0_seq1.p1 gnl/TRDRNA2_/TRDRNA2_43094_c0~~gnl/TRDRNA2_/TRDRNA2_43094_c0_seq1.p1  ORF type:complete len:597 (+),score=136.37 gnl/TRDRNA2_/TRDRNA2_43094_c0_seq1:56-1792(+)
MGAFVKGAPISVDDLFGYAKLQELLLFIVGNLHDQDEAIGQLRSESEAAAAKFDEQVQEVVTKALVETLPQHIEKTVQANPMVQVISDLQREMKGHEKSLHKAKTRIDQLEGHPTGGKTGDDAIVTAKSLSEVREDLAKEIDQIRQSVDGLPPRWSKDVDDTTSALRDAMQQRLTALEAECSHLAKKLKNQSPKVDARLEEMEAKMADLSNLSEQVMLLTQEAQGVGSKEALFDKLGEEGSPMMLIKSEMKTDIDNFSSILDQVSRTVTGLSMQMQGHSEQMASLNESVQTVIEGPSSFLSRTLLQGDGEEDESLQEKLERIDKRLSSGLQDAVGRISTLEEKLAALDSFAQETRRELKVLSADVRTDLWPQVRALNDREAMDVHRLLREIADVRTRLLEFLAKGAAGTARCLSCQTKAPQAGDKMMILGSDGKPYKRRPSTPQGGKSTPDTQGAWEPEPPKVHTKEPMSLLTKEPLSPAKTIGSKRPESQGGAGAVMRRYHDGVGRGAGAGGASMRFADAFGGGPTAASLQGSESAPELPLSLHRPHSAAASPGGSRRTSLADDGGRRTSLADDGEL